MKRVFWARNLITAVPSASSRRMRRRKRRLAPVRDGCLELLEGRYLLAVDFGDAPDIATGTAPGDYQTLLGDDGPRHTIVSGLMLGTHVDGDDGSLQNAAANADDITDAPDDEDGVVNPASDLVMTVGTQPTIALRVTNTAGNTATLYGWIDYNADGEFDNASERASVAIPNATDNEIVTLTFPQIPLSAQTGTTYARFRLSTSGAAADPTGAANNGEVEDYAVQISRPVDGRVGNSLKIASETNGGPALANEDRFGGAVAALGDLDGDGVNDLAVGANRDDTGGTNRGAVHLLLLNADGSVKTNLNKIGSETGGGPLLADDDYFGSSVASLGDLDGDGVTDLAVGAYRDNTGGPLRGAVHLLFLNTDGSVKDVRKIDNNTDNGPSLENYDRFGSAVSTLGDIDGDGVTDLAVGAPGDSTGGGFRGAVHVLFLNSDGSVKSARKIASGTNGGPTLANYDGFGHALTALGDLDGDGITELAAGAPFDSSERSIQGAVHVLFLDSTGSAKSTLRIDSNPNAGLTLSAYDFFGISMASLGDLDGDGVTDLAVGAYGDRTGGIARGAVHLLFLNADGSLNRSLKIADNTSGGPALADGDRFGSAVTVLGDLDGDGASDLAVGANRDDTQGTDRGAVHVLFLKSIPTDFGDAPDAAAGTSLGNYRTIRTDNGPGHGILPGLQLGASVDDDSGTLQNVAANADDVQGALPDDEDAVSHPASDLMLTVGTQPTIAVRVTNTTGSAATLYGWIDYNGDGDFDNISERTSMVVPDGLQNDILTITFPTIPFSAPIGRTYVRLRLSTDLVAANATGIAVDGEVEDHPITITRPIDRSVKGSLKIASDSNGLPPLTDSDRFGESVAALGDLDGDGVTDLAVGIRGDDTGGSARGAVQVLFLNPGGSVKNSLKIASDTNGGPTLVNADYFGSSVTSLGDLDGDGVTDLAVGAYGDDTGGSSRGAVYVLFLNIDGSVKNSLKIASNTNGLPALVNNDRFGRAVSSLGDLDGDGLVDLAVGADGDSSSGPGRGAVHVLLLNGDGSVKNSLKIASNTNGLPILANFDGFGRSLTSLGDLDGDGVTELAVGATGDDSGGTDRGAVHVLFLYDTGSVKASRKIADNTNGGPTLASYDYFGSSVALMGDLDGDGVADLAVGAYGDDTGGSARGAVHVLFLNADGSANSSLKIDDSVNGGPTLANSDRLGGSLTSLGDLDGDGATDLAAGASRDDTGGYDRGAVHIMFLKPTLDFGDAPDTSSGTGPGNYQTLVNDNGPSHTIVSGLMLGAIVDGDGGTLQNSMANADDVRGALPDDEDATSHPASDLMLTIGTQPTIAMRVTNMTGSAATLYGWIDYNANGDFDNFSERAAVVVPDGLQNDLVTLIFPTIPLSTPNGTTYARFRLSTDAAAANPTGAASDGEVEDYPVKITRRFDGRVQGSLKIASGTNGLPSLTNSDRFGDAVTALGDLDGDGVTDLAVGVPRDDTGGAQRGAVRILFMNPDGSVRNSTEIAHNTNGGPTLVNSDYFGSSLTSLGDLDGDGLTDLAVGAYGDGTGGVGRGAVYVLFLNVDGSVKNSLKIASDTGGLPTLADDDRFGRAVTWLGDLDGDGLADLAVGADGDDTGGTDRGAAHVLFLNGDGSVKNSVKIASDINGLSTLTDGDAFGRSLTSLGDLDGDGVTELAVGAQGDDTGGTARGAVHMLFLYDTGSVRSSLRIAHNTNGGPTLANSDNFGSSLALLGDLDGDGVADLAVGAYGDNTGGADRGAVHLLFLNPNGSVNNLLKVADTTGGGPSLANSDRFGAAVTALGDLNGDGVTDLAVGASQDNTGGTDRGAVHVLFLKPTVDFGDAPDTGSGIGSGNYQTLLTDNGPSHTIVSGLMLGAIVDGDDGTLQSPAANADDVNGALPDDEDAVSHPASDLVLTVGTQPTIALRVTNTTGSEAMLYGWIDYNGNGAFDNISERASLVVPDGLQNDIVTLTFPPILLSAPAGTTYARFRLSTDVAAANPTGAASDGEVEDYPVSITKRFNGGVQSSIKIASGTNGLPSLVNADRFGDAVSAIGDLDGDGVTDLAVGVPRDDTGGTQRGAVRVLFLNSDGSVRSSTEIAHNTNGGPTLVNSDYFGSSVTSLGDLDGDGITDLAVGAYGDDTGGSGRGAVHVLFLNVDGTVKSSLKIASDTNGLPALADDDRFGRAVTWLGDLDGDGLADLAVGADGDDTGGTNRGAVHVVFLNGDGSVKNSLKIASDSNGLPALTNADGFGRSLTSLGDLDGDGVTELAVGAQGDNTGGTDRGAVHILSLYDTGSVKSSLKIAHNSNGGPSLANADYFGSSVALLGDLDGDGVADLGVGADGDNTGGSDRGAVHVLFLNADGSVNRSLQIADMTSGGPTLANGDRFGSAIAVLGDLDGDGVTELAVGASLDNTGGTDRGAVHVLFMQRGKLTGDFNDDGFLDLLDIDALVVAIAGGSNPAAFDLDGNGLVNLADLDAWLVEAGNANLGPGRVYLLGDANLDSVVDAQDFIVWNSNKFTLVAAWSRGDFNADGVVDAQDFILWNSHKFQSADVNQPIVVVPQRPAGSHDPVETQRSTSASVVLPNEPGGHREIQFRQPPTAVAKRTLTAPRRGAAVSIPAGDEAEIHALDSIFARWGQVERVRRVGGVVGPFR